MDLKVKNITEPSMLEYYLALVLLGHSISYKLNLNVVIGKVVTDRVAYEGYQGSTN